MEYVHGNLEIRQNIHSSLLITMLLSFKYYELGEKFDLVYFKSAFYTLPPSETLGTAQSTLQQQVESHGPSSDSTTAKALH